MSSTIENKNITEHTDTEKRSRIVLLSLFISFSIFFIKISQDWGVDRSWFVYIVALGYILVTVLGLIWVFSFKVRLKSLPCLLQSALFVASEFLFIEMFFFDRLDRIYEGVLLLLILGLIWVATYISFLMSNIFNVGLYKDIPLEQVARTASYVLSLFMTYFLTFSFLAHGMPIYILLPVLLLFYFLVSTMHIRNLELERKDFWRKSVLSSLIMFVLFLGSFLIGSRHELVSIVPTVGFFISIGGISREYSEEELKKSIWFYSILLLLSFILNIWNNL